MQHTNDETGNPSLQAVAVTTRRYANGGCHPYPNVEQDIMLWAGLLLGYLRQHPKRLDAALRKFGWGKPRLSECSLAASSSLSTYMIYLSQVHCSSQKGNKGNMNQR